jgi:hypothetical protein
MGESVAFRPWEILMVGLELIVLLLAVSGAL